MASWSDNALTNGDAETGDLTGWTASGVTTPTGGTSGGSYCFLLETTASMEQDQSFSIQPPQVKVSLAWLPEDPIDPLLIDINAWLEATLEYADGTKDTTKVPLTR